MKRKIKNFNDFWNCIKAGKKVTGGNGYWAYFFINGHIYRISCDDLRSCDITFDDIGLEDKEVEEQDQFKIEVGEFYKTRNGTKAYCYRFEPKNEITKALFGFVVDNGAMFSTDIKGKYYFAPDGKSDFDIVGYW